MHKIQASPVNFFKLHHLLKLTRSVLFWKSLSISHSGLGSLSHKFGYFCHFGLVLILAGAFYFFCKFAGALSMCVRIVRA